MTPELKQSFNNIMDCFTGADGGVAFVQLRYLLEDMDERARQGDEHAVAVLQTVYHMDRLIKVANNG